jgi:hypothetical protein
MHSDKLGTPKIDIWYGPRQAFGQLGNPQRWVNGPGTVGGAEQVEPLTYSLNGGPQVSLSLDPFVRG